MPVVREQMLKAKALIDGQEYDKARSILEELAPTVPKAQEWLERLDKLIVSRENQISDNATKKSDLRKISDKNHALANATNPTGLPEQKKRIETNPPPTNSKLVLEPTIPLSVLDAPASVYISQPRYNKRDLPELVRENLVKKNSGFLPKKLTVKVFLSNIRMIYVPFWCVSGKASATWTAEYPETKYRDVIETSDCPRCGGTGTELDRSASRTCVKCGGNGKIRDKVNKPYKVWHPFKGSASVELEKSAFTARSKHRLLTSDKIEPSPEPDIVITPENTSRFESLMIIPSDLSNIESIRKDAESNLNKKLKQGARKNAGSEHHEFRKFKLSNQAVTISDKNLYVWLCPVYSGVYIFNNKKKKIHINAITGEVQAELPGSAVFKQYLSCLAIIILVPILLLGLCVVTYLIFGNS